MSQEVILLYSNLPEKTGMLEEVGHIVLPPGSDIDIICWGNRYFYRDPETDTYVEGTFLQVRMPLFTHVGES
jgi:hypothetical protein